MSVKLFKFMLILSLKTGRKEDIKWKFPQMVKCWQSVVSELAEDRNDNYVIFSNEMQPHCFAVTQMSSL